MSGMSSSAYIETVGLNELQWSKSYAQPRMNFHRSMNRPETPDDYISLLQQYLKLVPYLAAAFRHCELRTMSHPDLHLDNIFINPETNHISSVIDWQSTTISPMFQRQYPQFLEPLADSGQDSESPLMQYKDLVRRRDPIRWSMVNDPYHSIKTKPISLVPSCWDREDLFSLRNSLISIMAHWNDIALDAMPCLLVFTEEELVLHNTEMELIEGLSSIMHQLRDEAMIPLGGMVQPEDYERLKELSKRLKTDFVDLGENDGQRTLHANVWPY
jgi:hypothetical protein